MTKHFITGLKGVFIGEFIVEHKNTFTKVIGQAPINSGLTKREVIRNAKLNTLYKYSFSVGTSIKYDSVIHLTDYDISYLGSKGKKPLISVKRKNRTLKARRIRVNGEYKTQIYDKDDNYILSTEKWKKGDIQKVNTKKTKTQVTEVRDKKTNEVLIKQKYNKFDLEEFYNFN